MGRKRAPGAPPVVYRTARCGLRVTDRQARRLFGLLRSAGDVWCCVLDLNRWRRQRHDPQVVRYEDLCQELTAAGPGTFGELDVNGARSVLRRYCDAWFSAGKLRRAGDTAARFPRRKRALMPVRWYAGTFSVQGRVLRLPVARGCQPLQVRLAGQHVPGDRRLARRGARPRAHEGHSRHRRADLHRVPARRDRDRRRPHLLSHAHPRPDRRAVHRLSPSAPCRPARLTAEVRGLPGRVLGSWA